MTLLETFSLAAYMSICLVIYLLANWAGITQVIQVDRACMCSCESHKERERKRETMQCDHTWPASTHTVMGKAVCKHNSHEKTGKDEKISGSSTRHEGKDR